MVNTTHDIYKDEQLQYTYTDFMTALDKYEELQQTDDREHYILVTHIIGTVTE